MDKSVYVGLIGFGICVIINTLDGARMKMQEQPLWVAQSWRGFVRGIKGWVVFGALSLVVGIVGLVA